MILFDGYFIFTILHEHCNKTAMTNEEKYELLAEGETLIPSGMGVIPSDKVYKFSEQQIEKSLSSAKDFKLISFSEMRDIPDFAYLALDAKIAYQGHDYDVELLVIRTENLNLKDFGFANQISEDELNIALDQEYYLEVSMFFGDSPLSSFHLQLKILLAIVPDASLIIDFVSVRLLSAKWGRMAAKSSTPPSPDYLYALHAVYDGDDDENRLYWFHTHGLLRCGSVELELMNIKNGARQMNDLITMVVKKFINDPVAENEKFVIGYDGLGINLSWLRWEEALKDFPSKILGGKEDRKGEGNIHAEPSGVLFAVEDNNLISPEIYVTTLADNPIYYISNEETERMSALAKERFVYFKETFRKKGKTAKKGFFQKLFGKKQQDEESWTFLAKFGLQVDHLDSETEKEHLWFEVISITRDDAIEGKLLNQPYWISGLNKDEIKVYPISLLTDWLIYAPESTYSTDTIYQLL